MFDSFDSVLEVGAGDGFKNIIVKQFCKKLTISDIEIKNKMDFDQIKFSKIKFIIHNFVKNKLNRKFDGIYALDVLEHIAKREEKKFIKNICKSLKKWNFDNRNANFRKSSLRIKIVEKRSHKLQDEKRFKEILSSYFNNIYMFSMNDEVVHTGYDAMSHYIFAVACNKKLNLK